MESVSFSIFLRDRASSGLAAFANNGQKAFGAVDRAAAKTQSKVNGMGKTLGGWAVLSAAHLLALASFRLRLTLKT
jgi:hypothetical protein